MRRTVDVPQLFAPVSLAAVAVMAINDHWLKRLLHDPITGKLSDLAGCFFLPLYVSALLGLCVRWSRERRLLAGAGATIVFFAAIKLSTGVAAVVSCASARTLGWLGYAAHVRLTADPTDLIALPMVLFAYAYGATLPLPPPYPTFGFITHKETQGITIR
ncbi:MAG TPA: hypothetical protein VKZ18_21775 [Polyangia bacterium]|nr:hypothetical protein [Polyangia bacterium]